MTATVVSAVDGMRDHRYHDPDHHGNRDRHHNNFHRERR